MNLDGLRDSTRSECQQQLTDREANQAFRRGELLAKCKKFLLPYCQKLIAPDQLIYKDPHHRPVPMADSMAGCNEITHLEAATESLLHGEIMGELEDYCIPVDGLVAVGHTVREGLMAASFNVDEGLQAPALGLLRPETFARLREDGYTILHHVAATIGWIFRGSGSGSLISPGRIHDSVELPDDQEIVELEFYIMEEAMMPDWFRKKYFTRKKYEFSLSNTHWWLFIHDSVVVKIAKIGDEGIWIKAEKGGESSPLKNDGGIKLGTVRSFSHPKDWKDEDDEDSGRYSVRFEAVIKFGKGKEKLTVKQLKQLLSPSCGLDYSIFSSNCWQYAFSSANNVLSWNLENSEDEEVQGEIREKLEELKKLERTMPKDIFRALLKPSAPGRRESLVTSLSPKALLVHVTQKFVDWLASRREDMVDDGESASLNLQGPYEPEGLLSNRILSVESSVLNFPLIL